jgi:hypothetical protein
MFGRISGLAESLLKNVLLTFNIEAALGLAVVTEATRQSHHKKT